MRMRRFFWVYWWGIIRVSFLDALRDLFGSTVGLVVVAILGFATALANRELFGLAAFDNALDDLAAGFVGMSGVLVVWTIGHVLITPAKLAHKYYTETPIRVEYDPNDNVCHRDEEPDAAWSRTSTKLFRIRLTNETRARVDSVAVKLLGMTPVPREGPTSGAVFKKHLTGETMFTVDVGIPTYVLIANAHLARCSIRKADKSLVPAEEMIVETHSEPSREVGSSELFNVQLDIAISLHDRSILKRFVIQRKAGALSAMLE